MSTSYEIIRVGVPSIDGCHLVLAQKTFLSKQHVSVTLAHQLLADNGAPVDLYVLARQEDPQTSTTDIVEIPGLIIEAWQREVICGTLRKLTAEITDGATGEVQVLLETEHVREHGVFLIEWRAYRFDPEEDTPEVQLVKIWPSYLILEPTFADSGGLGAMPTVRDIKQSLLDREPSETALSDVFQFTDDEFVNAYRAPVEFFNEIVPEICTIYSTSSFSWREQWKNGIVGYLLTAVAEKMTRKKLPGLQQAGVLDEYAKDAEYRNMPMQYVPQFKTWAIATKSARAIQESFNVVYAP